jgi:hypothetical protein
MVSLHIVVKRFKKNTQEVDTMAFKHTNSKGVTYILHGKSRVTSTGKTTTLYFFSKEEKEGALNEVPAGYLVSETANGLLVLKKK